MQYDFFIHIAEIHPVGAVVEHRLDLRGDLLGRIGQVDLAEVVGEYHERLLRGCGYGRGGECKRGAKHPPAKLPERSFYHRISPFR